MHRRLQHPFQLLATLLVALIVLNTAFLTAAVNINKPEWAPAILVIAAIACVPMFLYFIFLMQTKFRVEMQDDKYYSEQKKIELSQKSSNMHRIMDDLGLGADAIISGKSILDLDFRKQEELRASMKEFEDPILHLEETNSLQFIADPNIILEFGKALIANREWARAAKYLDIYAIKKPDDWNGHFLRGVAHANTEGEAHVDRAALAAYSIAILTAPDDIDKNRMARFLSYRAAMLKRLGKLDDALSDLNIAEKLASNYYQGNRMNKLAGDK